MSDLEVFVRQVQSRTREHRQVISLLSSKSLSGQIISILRQEIDSMIRVIYLLSLPLDRRDQLIAAAVNGERWLREDLRTLVTEKEMVELAQRLTGWTFSVYKFGCAFIHLSAFHDYMNRDPLNHIAPNELADLVKHCRYYHGGPIAENPSFSDFVPFLPAVFEKIATNLEHYLEELREEKGLEHV